jgi:hypothetical protein
LVSDYDLSLRILSVGLSNAFSFSETVCSFIFLSSILTITSLVLVGWKHTSEQHTPTKFSCEVMHFHFERHSIEK